MPRIRLTVCLFLLLTLSACSGGSGSDAQNNGLTDIYAYEAQGSYVDTLARCARARKLEDACTLAELPFIAQETETPTTAQIMARVAVSHDWMGRRFEQALAQLPPSVLPLFSAVTAIIIDADIRPSFYWELTGAIYIDPAYLWLTNAEKQTINKQDDFRSDYADPLSFRVFNRYLINNNYAYEYWPLDDNRERSLSDIELNLTRIVLHELAHAIDHFPFGSAPHVSLNQTASEAITNLPFPYLSSDLSEQSPLVSATMYSLAGVMYRGNAPSEDDLHTTAAQAGHAFGGDSASDDYAYSSQFEDLAMLFENTMMRYFFDAEQEIGFARPLSSGAYYCDEYNIDWGATNRIGHPGVKERARFAVSAIMPYLDLSDFFDNLPVSARTDGNWCIAQPSISASSMAPTKQPIRPDEQRHPFIHPE